MQTCQNITAFSGVVSCSLSIINSIIPVIIAITVVWIIWGAFGLTRSEGEGRKKWRDVILYGIVGLFVMVSVYGLVNILTGTFGGLSGGSLPSVHITLPGSNANTSVSVPTFNSTPLPVGTLDQP